MITVTSRSRVKGEKKNTTQYVRVDLIRMGVQHIGAKSKTVIIHVVAPLP